jgi:predicted ATPase
MLAMTPSKSVLAIDEPEIHLHPKAQDKLCQILLDVAQKNNKQLVITTHSVHVLFFFVNATRKGELSADELAIWDFETKNAPPKRIVQDEGGDIYDWGREFGFP